MQIDNYLTKQSAAESRCGDSAGRKIPTFFNSPITMIKKILLSIVGFCFFAINTFYGQAVQYYHMTGAEFKHSWVSDSTYKISVTYFRPCDYVGVPYGGPTTFCIKDTCGFIT